MTGHQLTNETTLTAVRVEIIADAKFPTNRLRHVFGPREIAYFSSSPSIDGVEWFVAGSNVVCDTYRYTADMEPTNYLAKFILGDVGFQFNLSVVSPVSLEPRAWCAPTGAVWLAETGSCPGPGDVAVGLLTELYLLPDYVSFGKLFLQEGSCPATNITGFFAPYANSIQPHGLGVGAWNEVGVSETNNYAGTDFASANFGTIPIALGPGGFEYAITNYWYVKNNGVVDGRLHAFYVSPMKFCISENGNLSVEKYGLIATRNTNDVTTITRRP